MFDLDENLEIINKIKLNILTYINFSDNTLYLNDYKSYSYKRCTEENFIILYKYKVL